MFSLFFHVEYGRKYRHKRTFRSHAGMSPKTTFSPLASEQLGLFRYGPLCNFSTSWFLSASPVNKSDEKNSCQPQAVGVTRYLPCEVWPLNILVPQVACCDFVQSLSCLCLLTRNSWESNRLSVSPNPNTPLA